MKRSRFQLLPSAIALSMAASLLSGCEAPPQSGPPPAAAETSHLAKVKESGKITMLAVPHQESVFVRTNLDMGPMQRVASAEYFQGIDVEIMAAFAKSLGVDLELRPAVDAAGVPGYGELIPALLRGEGDIIASSFTINEDRKKRIDFSEPYFEVYPAVVTLADSPVTSPEDLEGKSASVIRGTSLERHLERAGFSGDQLVYVEFQFEGFASVIEGEADFTLQDSPTARRVVAQYPELKVACPFSEDRDFYGVGLPQGSDLRGPLNDFLESFRSSGELEAIIARWLKPVES